jgi:elongation factor P--beta-lysine ligase
VTQVGWSGWSIRFFSDTLCNSYLGVQTTKVARNPALDTWHQLVIDEVMAPAGSMSAEVYVYTVQEFAFQPVRARIDDLVFSVAGLFRDGFETGDLTEWSSSIP